MSDTGVDDYEGAQSGALTAEEIAINLRDLPTDFDELIQDAVATMSPDPGVEDWSSFGDEHTEHMEEVQKHALDLAENTGASADEIADTDGTNAEDLRGSSVPNGEGNLPDIG